MPRRIQLHRTKGWRKPEGAVVVARPTKWGNPFVVTDGDSARAAALYEDWLEHSVDPRAASLREDLHELAGRELACWCPPDRPCHADVLLRLANP